MKLFSVLAVAILLAGCLMPQQSQRYSYQITPDSINEETEHYEMTVIPLVVSDQLTGFTLTVKNKSDQAIEIDWNKTLYISGGQTNGGFVYEGIVYADRNNPRRPDVVFPRSKMTKVITPNNIMHLVPPTSGPGYSLAGGWVKLPITTGNAGVYLTIKHEGKENGHQLAFDVVTNKK